MVLRCLETKPFAEVRHGLPEVSNHFGKSRPNDAQCLCKLNTSQQAWKCYKVFAWGHKESFFQHWVQISVTWISHQAINNTKMYSYVAIRQCSRHLAQLSTYQIFSILRQHIPKSYRTFDVEFHLSNRREILWFLRLGVSNGKEGILFPCCFMFLLLATHWFWVSGTHSQFICGVYF